MNDVVCIEYEPSVFGANTDQPRPVLTDTDKYLPIRANKDERISCIEHKRYVLT